MSLKWAGERSRNTSFIILKTNSIHYAYEQGGCISIGLDESDYGNLGFPRWVSGFHSVSLVHLRTTSVGTLWACLHDNTCCIGWKQKTAWCTQTPLLVQKRCWTQDTFQYSGSARPSVRICEMVGTFGTSKGQNHCPSVTKWATGRQLGSQITNAGTNVLAVLFVCLFICMFVYFSLWIPQVLLTEAIFCLVRFNVFLCLSAVRQMLIYIHLICKCDSLRSVTAWFIFHVFARMFGYFLR